MRKNSIDTVLRVRLKHRPGQLARLAAAVAEQGAMIGEIVVVAAGEETTDRELTIETTDDAQAERVIAAVGQVDGVELLAVLDPVFQCHQGGKLHMTSRVELRQLRDLRYIYTPGVARVARAIAARPELAWELTTLGNSVGVFTNGTRVLGLGDIGPLASLPVMEGKAVLYDRLVGLSATPILIDTRDAGEFIDTVVRMAGSFGGVHLEDIRTPDCFHIEAELKRRLRQPVMHDDQHGTAVVALAAVINACRLTGTELRRARVGQIGLGAAGSAIAQLILAYGVGDVLVFDLAQAAVDRLAERGARPADLPTLMREADIVIATTGRPGLIRPDQVRAGQVIFSLSNPEPEIEPGAALAAGAAFAADGRSINNALAFPGIFKGALQARCRDITPEMLLSAAQAIAARAEPGQVVPSPLDAEVHKSVCRAVREQAGAQGLEGTARLGRS
jgi:malate dehydrogenase (oxaloacetate-decarboxylating)